MALSNAQALFLSNDLLLAGLLEDQPDRVQYLEALPFDRIAGDSQRVAVSSLADFGALPQADSGNVAVTPSQATPANKSFQLAGLVQDVTVADLHESAESNVNDQAEIQRRALARRMLYKYSDLFIKGDAAIAGQFDGLRKLVTVAQTVTVPSPGALSLRFLELLVEKIKTNAGRPDALLCNRIAWTVVRWAYYAAGINPTYVDLSAPDVRGDCRKVRCLAFDGIPFLLVDDRFQPNDEEYTNPIFLENATSIWATVFGPEGLQGLLVESSDPCSPRFSRVMDSTAADRTRGYWPVGLDLKTEKALARLQFVTTAAPVAP